MDKVYNDVSFNISRLITKTYSTSFSIAVSFLEPDKREAIYSIYAFVRLADEIVDTFHSSDKISLLDKYEQDYYYALKENVSLNPVLHTFAYTVKKYNISDELIQAFLKSMRADIDKIDFQTDEQLKEYIYGSADVVGLMCLCVFVDGSEYEYEKLKSPAMRLGAAFQKVNFLRDLKNDILDLDRRYFPDVCAKSFDDSIKSAIINDIQNDFDAALEGIAKLPGRSKFAVLVAYYYYRELLDKLDAVPSEKILQARIRVPDFKKFLLMIKAFFVYKFNIIK